MKVNYVYKRASQKFLHQPSGLAAQDFFFGGCCYVGWKHLYALKALTSTFKHLSGLSAYFGVTDFFKTTDFSSRKKHARCKPSTARGAGENRAFTS